MNTFLKEAYKVYELIIDKPDYYKALSVVMGNESCDLDSAISSLVYGFLLHHEGIQSCRSKSAVLPIFNIPQEDLPLKTEVVYFLERNNININDIPTRGYRNLLDLKKVDEAGALNLHLVDHHFLQSCDLSLKSSVKSIIDHRPQDPDWTWTNTDNVLIQPVGSCCSLIAKKMIETSPHLLTVEIANLLLGPIVIDTVNLSAAAGRATSIDEDVVAFLEKIVTIDRSQLLDDLTRAKCNIDTLTIAQVMRKDLKIIGGVPMAGIPILIQQFCKRSDFNQEVLKFLKERNSIPICILYGVLVEGENVRRDLAIFYTDEKVGDLLTRCVTDCENPSLELEEILDHGIQQMKLFEQKNLKATRKHIAPLIKKISSGIEEISACALG